MSTANRFPGDRDGTGRMLSSAFTIFNVQEAETRAMKHGAAPRHLQQLFQLQERWEFQRPGWTGFPVTSLAFGLKGNIPESIAAGAAGVERR